MLFVSAIVSRITITEIKAVPPPSTHTEPGRRGRRAFVFGRKVRRAARPNVQVRREVPCDGLEDGEQPLRDVLFKVGDDGRGLVPGAGGQGGVASAGERGVRGKRRAEERARARRAGAHPPSCAGCPRASDRRRQECAFAAMQTYLNSFPMATHRSFGGKSRLTWTLRSTRDRPVRTHTAAAAASAQASRQHTDGHQRAPQPQNNVPSPGHDS